MGTPVRQSRYSVLKEMEMNDFCFEISVVLLDLEEPKDGPVPFISGGGLKDRFNFAQLHFHWGEESERGSEHLIRSKQ